MATRYLRYHRTLKARSRGLRRDPTPAERKLWFGFLRGLPQKFTRQKPLGRSIADFYCSSCALVIEIGGDSRYMPGVRVLRFTNEDVMQRFEEVCEEILRALEASLARQTPEPEPLNPWK